MNSYLDIKYEEPHLYTVHQPEASMQIMKGKGKTLKKITMQSKSS